ncbi:hypothetical protein CHC122_13420 [Helicobacter pylori]
MWSENIIKIMPKLLFLFSLLQMFELLLTIDCMNKIEKIETKIINNLKMLESITILLNEHLECMDLEHSKDKKI